MAAPSTLFAADTNFLLDLANGEEDARDALEIIRKRVPGALICVPPTVIDELAAGVEIWTGDKRDLAITALTSLKAKWGLQPFDLIPAGHGVVDVNAANFVAAGLLPAEEWNDALILAESALLGCTLLITADAHLRGIDKNRLREILGDKHLTSLLIQTPRDIIKTFGGKVRR